MILNDQITKIGHTLKPHGIKGEFSVALDDVNIFSELTYLIICIEGIYVPFLIESIRAKGVDACIVKVKGYTNDSEVTELMGLDVYALNSELPVNDELEDSDVMYADDFIGYTIVDNGIKIGEIVDFDVTTENALFIVERQDKTELYIPMTDEFIVDINEETKTLQMILPVGLLEL